jgi:hypothetical protein
MHETGRRTEGPNGHVSTDRCRSKETGRSDRSPRPICSVRIPVIFRYRNRGGNRRSITETNPGQPVVVSNPAPHRPKRSGERLNTEHTENTERKTRIRSRFPAFFRVFREFRVQEIRSPSPWIRRTRNSHQEGTEPTEISEILSVSGFPSGDLRILPGRSVRSFCSRSVCSVGSVRLILKVLFSGQDC